MKVNKIVFSLILILGSLPIVFAQEKVINQNCQTPFELKYERKGIMFLLLEPKYFNAQNLKSLFV